MLKNSATALLLLWCIATATSVLAATNSYYHFVILGDSYTKGTNADNNGKSQTETPGSWRYQFASTLQKKLTPTLAKKVTFFGKMWFDSGQQKNYFGLGVALAQNQRGHYGQKSLPYTAWDGEAWYSILISDPNGVPEKNATSPGGTISSIGASGHLDDISCHTKYPYCNEKNFGGYFISHADAFAVSSSVQATNITDVIVWLGTNDIQNMVFTPVPTIPNPHPLCNYDSKTINAYSTTCFSAHYMYSYLRLITKIASRLNREKTNQAKHIYLIYPPAVSSGNYGAQKLQYMQDFDHLLRINIQKWQKSISSSYHVAVIPIDLDQDIRDYHYNVADNTMTKGDSPAFLHQCWNFDPHNTLLVSNIHPRQYPVHSTSKNTTCYDLIGQYFIAPVVLKNTFKMP